MQGFSVFSRVLDAGRSQRLKARLNGPSAGEISTFGCLDKVRRKNALNCLPVAGGLFFNDFDTAAVEQGIIYEIHR